MLVWGVVAPALVAVAWWIFTPAGLPGSLGGMAILIGAIVVAIGVSLAGGVDAGLDNLHPGANVGRMSEQGMGAEQRHLGPRARWRGTRVMLAGAAYLAVGAALWQLR